MKIKDCEIRVIKQDSAEIGASAIVNAADNDETKIRDSFKNSLKAADGSGLKSVVFTVTQTPAGGLPLLASAKIISQEIWRYLREEKSDLREITFCLIDQETFDIFEKGVIKYLEHVLYKLQNGPFSTVDAIIEIDGGIVIIQRSNPPFGWALPGGFVDYGESLEVAVVREAKEETGLDITDVKQFHTYSDPKRDPRFHTIGTVFIAKAKGKPQAGDDAAGLKIVKLSEILKINLAFDHKKILEDYIKYREG